MSRQLPASKTFAVPQINPDASSTAAADDLPDHISDDDLALALRLVSWNARDLRHFLRGLEPR